MRKKILYSITILLIGSISCTNQNYEDRIKKLEDQISKMDSSKTVLLEKYEKQKSITENNKNTDKEQKNQSYKNVEKKFVGTWKYLKSVPAAKDNSLNGMTCILEKYSNTKKTFVFHLWSGHDLILSIKDENTLIGQNANFDIMYDTNTDHISLILGNGDKDIYSRLE